MPKEIDFLGLLLPAVVPLFFLSVAVLWLVDRQILLRWRVYRFVAFPALFRICLFVVIFCLAALLIY